MSCDPHEVFTRVYIWLILICCLIFNSPAAEGMTAFFLSGKLMVNDLKKKNLNWHNEFLSVESSFRKCAWFLCMVEKISTGLTWGQLRLVECLAAEWLSSVLICVFAWW